MSLLSSIARSFGLEAKAKARLGAASRGAVLPDLSLWDASARIGGGVTPTKISNIIRAADGGDMRQLMDLANECRQRDAHLQAVLATSEESIVGLQWQLVATDPHERTKDKRAREWCERVLRATPALVRLIGHLAGGVYYSYAVSETMWAKAEGKLVPTDFKSIAHRRFGFKLDDGSFVYRDPYQSTNEGLDFRAEYPHKFVVTQPRVTGDIANREGLCRVLVWMSVFRNWVIGDWLKTAEISWKPWRIGTFNKGTSAEEDRAALEDVMRRLTTDGAAVLPNTSTIKVEWPGGSGMNRSTHAEFVNVIGQEMSKAALGQTETTQASASSGYAQAKVHNQVRYDLRDSRARQVAHDITRDLVASMILLNFGPDIAIPRFEFILEEPADLEAFGTALSLLVDAGLEIPQKWAREHAGIPEPKDGEAILVKVKPPAPQLPPGAPSPGKPANDGASPDGQAPAPAPDNNPAEEATPATSTPAKQLDAA